MKIIYVKSANDFEVFETSAKTVAAAFNFIKYKKGLPFIKEIVTTPKKHVLLDSTERLKPIEFKKELLHSDLMGYDTLLITEEIEGEWALAGIIVAAMAVTAAYAIVAQVIVYIILMAILLVVEMLIFQALSPSPGFQEDPARSQGELAQSNLFNGAGMVREQGGVTPIIFGEPFCYGVLINSSILTSDIIS